MWERNFNRNLIFSSLFGWLTWITVVSVVCADGRVFLLDLRNTSDSQELGAAEHACVSHGARLASAEELRHAVVECSFSECTRGWLYGGTVGTTVCSNVGSALKAVDVKTENATEDTTHLHAFCVKDTGVPCGDPPSFPNTRLQGHTGFELGDELLYTCVPGHVMPSGHSVFSLLCDSCGEWYGLVQLCVKDGTEPHIDYEDKFTGDQHLAYEDLEDLSEDEQLEEAQGEVQEEAQEEVQEEVQAEVQEEAQGEVQEAAYVAEEEEHRSQEQQEASFSVEGGEDTEEEAGEEEAGEEEAGEEDRGEETAAPEEEGEERGGEEMSVGEEQQEEEEEEGLLTGGEEEEDVVEGVEGVDSSDSPGEEQEEVLGTVADAGVVTEAPVSLLSQKHLFWFPSEAFQEAGHPVPTQPPIIQTTPSDGDNRVKASGSETEDVKEDDSQESHYKQPDDPFDDSHDELEDHDKEDLNSHEEIDHGVHDDHEHIDHDDHDDVVDVDHDDHDKHDDHDEHYKHSKHDDDHEKGGRYDDDDDQEKHYDMGEHEDDRDSVLYGSQGEHVVREDDHDDHDDHDHHDDHDNHDHHDNHDDHDHHDHHDNHDNHDHHDDVTDDHDDHSEEHSEEHSDPDSHPDDHDHSDDHDTSEDQDDHDEDSDHDRYDDHDDHDSHEDHDDHEHHVAPPVVMPTDDPQNVTQEGAGREQTASTEELWLDGYPVVPDETEKVGDSSTEEGPGSEEPEEELVVKGTDSPNEVEMSQPTAVTSFSQSPSQGAEEGWPELAHTTSPDHLTPSDPNTDDYTVAPGPDTWEDATTEHVHHFLDHGLQPTARDDDITGLEEERADGNMTQRAREGVDDGEVGEAACTDEDCPPPPPPSSGRGPTVAAIVVAVCAVAVAAVAGAWCYRRRQQKTSMYEMNGKGQSPSGQQIEMQQKV